MTSGRKTWAALLVFAAIPIGFALGAWAGARLLVPAGAGLVGGAMVLWYGLLGVLLALAAGIVAIRALDPSRLKPVALTAGGLATAVLVMIGLMVTEQRREHDAHFRQSMAMLPPFELVLAGSIATAVHRFAYDSEDNDWRVQRADGGQCRGGLPADKAGDRARLELLSALRGLDVAGVLVHPPACQQAGKALAILEVEIREHKPPVTTGRLRLTRACRKQIPEVEALLESVAAVYRRHGRELVCQ